MTFQAVANQRLYQQVADQISESIRRGNLAVGARLPPERDLARQFDVSRPTVREALIALELAGLVEIRTGSGAYVCRPAATAGATPPKLTDTGPSPFELVTARRLIEPAVAAQAALNATKADLVKIAEALAEFERHWTGTHWEKLEADRQFHMSLAAATHNAVIIAIVEELWRGMFGRIFAVLSERTQLTNQQSMTMHDHRVILHCIERHDAAGAQAAMLTHLVHVEHTLHELDRQGARERVAETQASRA
jgi:DNA-binding FadR family transcriptional regulator